MAFQGAALFIFHDIGIFGPDYWSARYWTTYYRSDYTGYLLQLPITQETDVRREAEAPTRFSLENRLADGDWTCPVRRVHLRGYTWGSAPFMKTAAEKREVREAAESYLEQKYNEPFKVTDVDYTWAIGSYNLKAHPVQSPELEFTLSE